MHLRASLTKFWAYSSMLLVTGIILFLFGYVFYRGAGTISWEFLSQPPRGAVLGEEGGIWPAIVGSLCFTATAIVLGGIPAVATALYMVFYCKGRRMAGLIRMVIQCISGIPSIVLGLFAYSFLVRDLAWGRCILSSGVALAVMILPFIEVRAEKTFRELPKQLVLLCPGLFQVLHHPEDCAAGLQGGDRVGCDTGRLLRHGGHGPSHIHRGSGVFRPPGPAHRSGHGPAHASLPAGSPGSHFHGRGLWDCFCHDGADFIQQPFGNNLRKEEPEKMEHIMTLHNVSASYDGREVLSDLSLDIPARRITAVIGPSGCGKTTLLRCMNGLLTEEKGVSVSGRILLDGQEIKSMQKDVLRRRVGLVFQTPAPFPFSIYKNMTYAPRYYGIRDKASLEALVKEKLQMAGLYDEVREDLGRNALKLSGGQQQRLCIARALTVDPEVLLLDEPCSALDVKSSAVIEEMLTELKKQYTIVIVTHNIAQARRISDYGAFLLGGRLVEWGESDQLFGCPAQEETRAFLAGIYG